MHAPLILASSSPYRKELLSRLGLDFETRTPNVDETPLGGESFVNTAIRLAREKALWIAKRHPEAIVIGADQVAVCNDQRLDKPGTNAHALEQLQLQRGQTSVFYTAVCVAGLGGDHAEEAMVPTQVRFRGVEELPDTLLQRYIEIEQPLDCAGSAKSEGLGITLISAIEGSDPTALIGLPLIALTEILNRFGVSALKHYP